MRPGYNSPPENLNLQEKPTPSPPKEGYRPNIPLVNPIPPGQRPEPTTLSPQPRGGLYFSTSEPITFAWDNSEQNGTYFESSQDEQFVEQLKRCIENNTGGIREILNGQKG